MVSLLKVFLPYTMLLAIGVAVYVSNYHPAAEVVMIEDRSDDATEAMPKTSSKNSGVFRDPVCRMEVNPSWGWHAVYKGRDYYFCVQRCRDKFAQDPEKYVADRCIVCECDKAADAGIDRATAPWTDYLGETYYFCSDEHIERFKVDPGGYFMHTMWGTPEWMYYCSIAFVLVVSFGLFEWLGRRWTHSSSPPTSSSKARVDLMQFRPLRWAFTSRPLRFVCQAVFVVAFFLIIAAGLFGEQNAGLNIAPLLTWTVWWGGLVVLIMFAGKAWCFVCPWDAVAGWMEKLRFWKKNDDGMSLNLKWPKAIRNILLATLLFVGLTWVELGFEVTMTPRGTAYLGIAMLLMAIVSAFLFERKSFCRYGCLVGRVSGLYALFSGIEIRSRNKDICQGCRSKECVSGSPTAYGCPTLVYPGGLEANTYCIQCGECLQACPENNLAVNLRPWGSDLVDLRKPRTDEAYLALLMLSITAFHGLTMTPVWGEMTAWVERALDIIPLISFSAGMTAIMLAPILVYGLLVMVSYRLGSRRASVGVKELSYRDYFIRYAYALLPIALFYHLAHNLEHLLIEGPKVFRLASDPFGYGWNSLMAADLSVPPLVSLDVLWILQIMLVLVGHVYSLWAAGRVSVNIFGDRKAALLSQLPMLVGMICFSVFSLWLLKQPMVMRTAM
ncbi:MAG TPA: YHS domain-containing protein [Thermoguttaceae bacterium]|nr:YHS domain-containing protein [Thermoguttaceae bacterium]